MFSEIYSELDREVRNILIDIESESLDANEILKKSKTQKISLTEAAYLLNPREQIVEIKEFVFENFRYDDKKNIVRPIAPIYISSYCVDACRYCNFSGNRSDGTRLNLDELKEELEAVSDIGYRLIEFTLGTDPEFTPERLAEYISTAKSMLGKDNSGIFLCSDYFEVEDYRRLKDAGLDGMVQWDETLDKEKYMKWHKNSPRKSKFEERIDNHDRAIQAGLKVAAGCLFGLADYRYDVLMQIAKARYLEKEYGVKPFVFGTPRIKSIGGKQLNIRDKVYNNQYELALMVYKIAEPLVARWLQTREDPILNLRNVLHGDFYTYNCGGVVPGGYCVHKDLNNCSKGQFSVNDMTKEEFEHTFKQMGFKINYAWNIG